MVAFLRIRMGLGASSFIKRTFVFIHLGDWQMESLRKIEVITPKDTEI